MTDTVKETTMAEDDDAKKEHSASTAEVAAEDSTKDDAKGAAEQEPAPDDSGEEKKPAAEAEEREREREEELELEVPMDKLGAIIGRGGSEIASIRSESGAEVSLPSREEQEELSAAGKTAAAVRIAGSSGAVAKAKALIEAAMDRPRAAAPAPALVTLAGFKFHGKGALFKHCQRIIDECAEGEPLSGSAAFFAFALLSHHPSADAKCGDGLAAIKYGTNEKFPDTKCFIAVREDGSEESFSYKKCVEAAFEKARQSANGGGGAKRPRDDGGGGDDDAAAKVQRTEFVPGLVVVADGMDESVGFRELKETFGDYGDVKYVELREGKAFVRFTDAAGASAAAAAGQKEIDGETVSVVLLDGDEERSYWERLWASQERWAAREAGGRGGRGGRGRGGRRGGRGRGRRNRR